MSRIAVSRPPGVSIWRTTIRLPFVRAVSSALVTYREVAGPMAPLTSRTMAVEDLAAAADCSGAATLAAGDNAPGDDDTADGEAGDGDTAGAELGITAITAIRASPAKAATVAPRRTWRRAEQAFTALILFHWRKSQAISAELSEAFHLAPGKKRGFCRVGIG